MNVITVKQMEEIQGGFAWASFVGGIACGVGLLTAETGAGLLLAGAFCIGSALPDD
jgi:hypothetical protein